MTTGGHAKQPIVLQETQQEKESDKTEDGQMNKEQGLAWQQMAQDRVNRRLGEKA